MIMLLFTRPLTYATRIRTSANLFIVRSVLGQCFLPLIGFRRYLWLFVVVSSSFACIRCKPDQSTSALAPTDGHQSVSLRYAQGFSVRYDGKRKWVEVKTPYQ